ncbi:hypothetical protein EWM64_g3904, partial [Hericium alpestre]
AAGFFVPFTALAMDVHGGHNLSTSLLDNNLSLHLNLRALNARTQELEAKLAAAEQRLVKAKARIQRSLDVIDISDDDDEPAASQTSTQRGNGQEPEVIDISEEPDIPSQTLMRGSNRVQSDVIDISEEPDVPSQTSTQRSNGEQSDIIDISSDSEDESGVATCVSKQQSVQDKACTAPRAHGRKRAAANALESRCVAVRSRDNASCLGTGSQAAASCPGVVSTTSDEHPSKRSRMDISSTGVQDAELKITLPSAFKRDDPYILRVPLPPHVSGRIQTQSLPKIVVTKRFMREQLNTITQTKQLNWDTVRVLDYSFLDPCVDPLAPLTPGNAGAFFSFGSEVDEKTLPKRIHVFVGNLKSDKYQYRGDYEIADANPHKLPLAAWVRLRTTCKDKWIRRVEDGTNLLAQRMRARIIYGYKKRGQEPTPTEIDAVMKGHMRPDSQAIREAFNRGYVSLNMWALVCVGFDPSLVKAIQEKQQSTGSG